MKLIVGSMRGVRAGAGSRALISAALVVVPLVSTAAAVPAAANPVISSVAPDPSVQRGADGAFHVYASSDDWADSAGYRLIPHFRSFDLTEWEYVGDAFGSRPAWSPAGSFLWAPDVHVTDSGSAVMYYSTGGELPCIGRATAPDISGGWIHDAAPIVCFGADEPYHDLDPMGPEVVFRPGEPPVMFMGNFEGIHAVEMNVAGTALEGEPVLVAGAGVEAPAVVTRQDKTHLFTSAGLCCNGEDSRYRVLGGRADDLMGPYTDRLDRPLVQGPGEPLPGDVILQGDDDWVGPGHVDVVADDAGQDWMLYHAAPRGSAVLPNGIQRRYMMIDRLTWNDGWPAVGRDGTPSSGPADPVVTLPVRLTAVGSASLRPDGSGEVLDASVRIDSTGAGYQGHLSATLTGPSKGRAAAPFIVEGEPVQTIPVSVGAGATVTRALSLRPVGTLAPGRYELVVSVGPAGGAAQELAVFGLEVAPDGSLSMGSGALGSAPLGSLGG